MNMIMPEKRPRILIADDHALVAELCRNLLQKEFDVVGIVCDGRALLQSAADLRPDVIVIDVGMPILNGLDAGQRVKEILPAVKLVYLTMNPIPEVALEAFRRGASGYLLKTCTPNEMIVAIRGVLQGMSWMSPHLTRYTLDDLRSRPSRLADELGQLTGRQREVLQLLAEGKLAKEVADVLGIAPVTVIYHKKRIMHVLGVRSNADLVRYAARNYLVAA